MCRDFRTLAHLDETHFVGQCEHATVSLTWGHCTWHLAPADFLTLAALLPEGEGQTHCFVLDRYDGKRVLWCGDSCLVLRGERFSDLCRLVARAAPMTSQVRQTGPGQTVHRLLN